MDGAVSLKKVLITGQAGFIGRNLHKNLRNYDLTALTRQVCDLTKKAEVDRFFDGKFFDAVIHAAVVGGNRLVQDDSSVLDQNLIMYYNLLGNKGHFSKFIHFGSGATPTSPYGLSKHTILHSILDKPNFYNINIFAVFGEDEADRRFIKSSIRNYIEGRPITIFQDRYMDFFYIKDLIALVEHYLDNDNLPKSIDCTYADTFTLLHIANMINDLSDHKVYIVINNEGLATPYSGVFTKLPLRFLGLKTGIRQVYNLLKPEE